VPCPQQPASGRPEDESVATFHHQALDAHRGADQGPARVDERGARHAGPDARAGRGAPQDDQEHAITTTVVCFPTRARRRTGSSPRRYQPRTAALALSLVPRFTIAEAVVLVAVSMWQILYLKSFFEVKRVV
jgi:hypothetical protein